MLKFSRFLITLPLLALPLAAVAPKPALAETVGLERALELLAKSVVVDNKCNVLTVSERDELSNYVAKAEVAAAEKTTVNVTRSAFSAGQSQGRAATCGAVASQEVKETLTAAREAINAAEQANSQATEPARAFATPAPRGGLSVYGRIIETYYLERRCAFLSRRKMNYFYRAVVKSHRTVISEFGKSAVSKVMKSAEARSNYQGCNGVGEARVKAGFAEVASR
ncbi:MAG TPA: hypothetical protein VM144_06750 [Aestuariivirga sp.]|nr:hypothetical protein [Aestuariivirga sp.]